MDGEAGMRRTRAAFFANRVLSQAGQGVFLAGLFLLAGTGDSPAAGLGSLMVATMAAAILCGLPAGALGDRLGAGRALVLGAVGRALAIAAVLVLPPGPATLAAVAFSYSALSQLFSPAELAIVSVVAPKRPAGGHAALVALQHVGQGAGMIAIGPAAFFLGGADLMVAVALAMYAGVIGISAFLGMRVARLRPVAPARHAFSFGSTLRYFSGRPVAAYAVVLLAFAEMAGKTLVMAVPQYIETDLGLSSIEQMALIVPGGLGAVLGLLWSGRFLHVGIAPGAMRLALLGAVASITALAGLGNIFAEIAQLGAIDMMTFLHNPERFSVVVAVPVALTLGVCFALTPIAGRTILSATAPDGQHARVFATQAMMSDVLSILPLVVFGLSAELAGARATFLFVGLLGAAVIVMLELPRLRPSFLGGTRAAEQAA